MKLSVIVAAADNGVIGVGNQLPWELPADLARFKELTMGHHLILGRRTFDSIGRVLPGRVMVVVSRGTPDLPDGVRLADSVDAAIAVAETAEETEAFVAGGAEIYRQLLPRADRLYLTRVHADLDGDTFFPDFDESEWRLISEERVEADADHPHAFTFLFYERKG